MRVIVGDECGLLKEVALGAGGASSGSGTTAAAAAAVGVQDGEAETAVTVSGAQATQQLKKPVLLPDGSLKPVARSIDMAERRMHGEGGQSIIVKWGHQGREHGVQHMRLVGPASDPATMLAVATRCVCVCVQRVTR